MRSLVTGQFIRTRKPPPTVLPVTDEGTFARVGSCVGFQVGGFEVVLAAALVGAFVDAAAKGDGCRGGLWRCEEEDLGWDEGGFAVCC